MDIQPDITILYQLQDLVLARYLGQNKIVIELEYTKM